MSTLRRDLGPILTLFLREQRRMLVGGALLAAATVLAGIALLGLSGWFIAATALAGASAATALAFDVFAPSAGIRFLALARTAGRYGERLVTHHATLGVLAGLRVRLFRGWAAPGAARLLLMRPARLLFRLTADVDALDSLYLRVLVPAFAAVGAAVAAGVVLGILYPPLGAGAFVWLLVAGLGIPVVIARRARRPGRRQAHATEALRARVVDLVAGQTELAMAGRLAAQRSAVADADGRQTAADDALNRLDGGAAAAFGAASAVLLAATLAAVMLLADADIIGAPGAALALLVAFAAVEPFAALRRGCLELARTLRAARRIAPRLAPAAERPGHRPPPEGHAVRLDAVTAGHDADGAAVLRDISLALARGEHLAVIGPSGAGKSTLLSVLAGEVAAQTGAAQNLPATLMTQRTELFQDSLRENLRLADPGADDERLLAMLAAAGLRRDVEALPAGLDTRLGEGGLGLSGGQARRLSLARLFLRDTPVWLLDEPTDGLDGETARDILRRLAELARGRTLIVATHLRREAALADRLVILKHGRVVASPRRGEAAYQAALAGLRPD